MVASASGLGIERQRQVRDTVHAGVDARQHGILVHGITRRGREVPIHTLAATVHIAGGGSNIRIVVICTGGIVDTVPAIGEGVGIRHARIIRVALKAVLIRQAGNKITSRADGEHTHPRGVRAAHCHQVEVIHRIARKTRDGAHRVGKVGIRGISVTHRKACGTISDSPRRTDVVGPVEIYRIRLHATRGKRLRSRTIGNVHTAHIDFKTRILHRTITMESNSDRTSCVERTEALHHRNSVVVKQRLAASSHTRIDAEIVVRTLCIRAATDHQGMKAVGRIHHQFGTTDAVAIRTRRTTIIIYRGGTGAQGVATAGSHIHNNKSHAKADRTVPNAAVARADGSYVCIIHTSRQIANRKASVVGRANVDHCRVGIETARSPCHYPSGRICGFGPSELHLVVVNRDRQVGRRQTE